LSLSISFFLSPYVAIPVVHSFPTRRSSDLCHCRRASLCPSRGRAFRGRASASILYAMWAVVVGRRKSVGARAWLLQPSGLRLKRSEEHTSELQSRSDLVCRLLLEKKK